MATASVRTGFAMTVFLQGVRYKPGRVVREADPYGCVTRGAVRRADVGIGPYGVFTDRIS